MSSFFAITLFNNNVINIWIFIRFASKITNLPDTINLSNERILGFYIAEYEQLAEITLSSQNWRYMDFQAGLNEVQIILRDGRRRKQLSEKSEFLTQYRDEKYRQ